MQHNFKHFFKPNRGQAFVIFYVHFMAILAVICIILFLLAALYLVMVGMYQYGNESTISPLGLFVYFKYPATLLEQGLFPPYGKNSSGLTVGTTLTGLKKVPKV